MTKSIKATQYRSAKIDTVKIENEIIEFSFSSELPVERAWGMEILSHAAGAMDFTRLKNSAPLLFNHNGDLHLGVILDAWIENKKGYCRAKISRTEFGQEKYKDIADGILVNVSFGYEIKSIKLQSEEDGKPPEYLVNKYLPFEISMVTIPADFTVGLGRSKENEKEISLDDEEDESDSPDADNDEDDQEKRDSDSDEESEEDEQERKLNSNNLNKGEIKMEIQEIQKNETQRVMAIMTLGEKHEQRDLAKKFVEEGKTPEQFALMLVDKLEGRSQKIDTTPVDLSNKEKKEYSLSRAILAQVNRDWTGAGFEKEISDTIAKKMGRSSEGFFMPTNVGVRAPYVAGTAAYGGNLIQTNVLGDQFIDALRNRAVVVNAGATVLSNLTSLISIPRKNGRSAAYWIAENGTITESEATFDQVSFGPKKVAALSVVSRELLQQSNMSVDAMIADDLNKEVALAIDLAALHGTGSGGQPKGIINQSGIGSVPIGTNGGALTFDHLIALETAVASGNADVNKMAYITNAKQVGALKAYKGSTGFYLWSSTPTGSPANFSGPTSTATGQVNGYDIYRTNQVAGNLTKGSGVNLSAVFFGDWSQLVIAQWMPGIEILVNPYGTTFTTAGIAIRAISMVDCNIRTPASFAVITDAT